MRIKFLRILPETCASTWCLFSSSTLNMALGRGSTTTAITSIASSLLIQPRKISCQLPVVSHEFHVSKAAQSTGYWQLFRQDHRSVPGHRNAMFEVGAVTAVFGHCRPLIVKYSRTRPTDVHHGLDRQDHAVAQLRPVPGGPVVRNLRVLVQLRTDAVPDELPHHTETVGLNHLLHGCAHVPNRIAHSRCIYSVK